MAQQPIGEDCESCNAWIDGKCHRHPPVYTSGHPVWEWPQTVATDWCSEFYRIAPR